jgi:hypothetical protein
MSSNYQTIIHRWIRQITNKAPNDRNAPEIAEKVMLRHFKSIYTTVGFCREMVQIAMVAIVRRFLKQYSTDPDINKQDWDALFQHFGIIDLSEQTLLKKIQVQTVWVPSKDKFCNVHDRKDCDEQDLDEAAEYLDKLSGEIHERAEYLRMLANYRRRNR